MRRRSRAGLVAVGTALMLMASACGGGGESEESAAEGVSVRGCEPENPLLPGDTNEVCGGRVVDALFTGLVEYDPKTAQPRNAMAESIETEDSQFYTVKIKQGWKFHDGTEVKAKNFVDAWNYTAHSENGLQNGPWFEQFEGFEDVFTVDPDEDGPKEAPEPESDKLSGLKVIDDYTFEIRLSAPYGVLPAKLGYTVFSPLPDAFFANPEAFGTKPIGNGPFKFVSWQNNRSIEVQRDDAYAGPVKAKVQKITYRMYQDDNAAYADLASDNLDFTELIPVSALTGDKWKSDLGERAIEGEQGVIQNVNFPLYSDTFKQPGSTDFRKAISLATDRKTITDRIFNGGRIPATGWVSPIVEGYKAGACGEFCTYDPAKAKEHLQRAEDAGFNIPNELSLEYNGDADHKAWAEAFCNGLNQTLEGKVNCVAKPIPTFDEFRTKINAFEMEGMYRAGWQMDFPHIENFLNPLVRTNAASNDGKYSNKELDAKLAEADRAEDPAEGIALYQEAEAMLAADMPTIPLWYYGLQAGHSTKVKNVQVTPFGELDFYSIELA